MVLFISQIKALPLRLPLIAKVTFSGCRAILCPFGLFWFSECKDIEKDDKSCIFVLRIKIS